LVKDVLQDYSIQKDPVMHIVTDNVSTLLGEYGQLTERPRENVK